jgi:hypothetical protein
MRNLYRLLSHFTLVCGAIHIAPAATGPPNVWAVDLAGHPVTRLAPAGTRAVVLFFAATDCPIANRYVPEIERLARDEEHAGVTVWFVYPNPGDTADAVRAHRAQFAITGNALLDARHTLVRLAHATVTPEAAVFVPTVGGLREVYHGRIDDRYAGLGRERPQATHHDLEDAIHAVLEGRPVPEPVGKPVGCAIMPLGR